MPGKEEDTVLSEISELKLAEVGTKECIRIVVLGAAAVGKTAIIQQFLYSHFLADYKPTVEDLYTVEYDSSKDSNVTVEILDTSGTYEFPAMRRLAIERADAFVLIYSVTDTKSFDQVKALRTEIKAVRGIDTDIPVVVVGNKYDEVDDKDEEMRALVLSLELTVTQMWQLRFYKCSAKTDQNIINVFIYLMNNAKIQCSPKIVEEKRRKSLPVYLYKTNENKNRSLQRHSCTIS